jgi:sulfate adenylyltransferase subunit 1
MAISKPVNRSTLRFLTCGNVDDGKSTLIGRLLWDANLVKEDHRESVQSRQIKLANGDTHPDFASLLDGLQAEREQGITIDVAYRYFSTPRRSFIVADTPGHEQYTRNMVTGASTAHLAVLLVDVRTGLTTQTRRHALIAAKLGIRNLVLVVNKMDLIAYDKRQFEQIAEAFRLFAKTLAVDTIEVIPTSAALGYNVVHGAQSVMPWYQGSTLLDFLETIDIAAANTAPMRFSVQRVCRPDESFRGIQGTITGSAISRGQEVRIMPSGHRVVVDRIVTMDGDLARAECGRAATLVLDRPVDIARGDLITQIDHRLMTGRKFSAELVVLSNHELDPSLRYELKSSSRRQTVRLEPFEVVNLEIGNWVETSSLLSNSIVRTRLLFEQDAAFDSYDENAATGSAILIDPRTHATVAGVMITEQLDSSEYIKSENQKRVSISLPADMLSAILAHPAIEVRKHEVRLLEGVEMPNSEADSVFC